MEKTKILGFLALIVVVGAGAYFLFTTNKKNTTKPETKPETPPVETS